jgi:hypothetical protein
MKDACGSIFSLREEDGRKHGSGAETPRCAKVKIETAFLDEGGQGGNEIGLGNAIMEILGNIDSKLLGRFDQGLKGIPRVDPLGRACAAALTSRLRTRCLAPNSAGLLCKRISGWESTISNASFLPIVNALRSSNCW